jgi:hypothetical protein
MSAELYRTRLFWDGRRGIAKSEGVSVELLDAPPVAGVAHLTEIDYAPQVHVAMVRESANGWRDMTHTEILAADAVLVRMVAGARLPLQPPTPTTTGAKK